MRNEPLLQLDLPGIRKFKTGKVREVFDLGEHLLIVATDRISAFDCVLPNGIPRKGEVLTQLSHFWLDQTRDLVPNHRVAGPDDPCRSSDGLLGLGFGRRQAACHPALELGRHPPVPVPKEAHRGRHEERPDDRGVEGD